MLPIKHVLIVILLGLVSFYLISNHKQRNSELIVPPNQNTASFCLDLKQLTEIIVGSIKYPGKADVYQRTERKDYSKYMWKFDETEPFRTYPTVLPYQIDYFGQEAKSTDQNFRVQALPKIIAAGYQLDKTNTSEFKEEETIIRSSSRYGFTKANAQFQINIHNLDYQVKNNISIEVPKNSSGITVSCGIPDPEFDAFYNQVKKSSRYNENTILDIWSMQDDVVMMNVMELGSFGGAADYWIKTQKGWQWAVTTQDVPPCEVFEKEHVGKGMACYDNKTQNTRSVL